MFLKSLEIQGFKSFADKMTFTFSPGVTAIVGPNGSGKSNVVDAIRWVLGEQSVKTLRGSKMEDVIFSGSTDRKPVGMARVTMILDNSKRVLAENGDEIEVSRSLYRSGESQYMLGKHPCRLKDIQELFMDTGLGKDGFSVIGQGKIEEILTLHAQERRGLIEEAAGISKYKYRKREAERKLESTNDDMTRLDDMLYDLEKRIDPLAVQAEKVKSYRQLKAEQDALELAYLTRGYLKEKAAFEKHKEALESQKAGVEDLKNQLEGAQRALDADKMTLGEKRAVVENAQMAYTELLRKTQEDEKEKGILDERLQFMARSYAAAQETITQSEAHLVVVEEKHAALQVSYNENEKAFQAVEAQLAQEKAVVANQEAAIREQKTQLEELQSEQFGVLSGQANVRNEMSRLEQALSGDSARKNRLENRLEALRAQKEDIDAKVLSQLEKQKEAVKEEKALKEAIQALDVERGRKQEALIALEDRHQKITDSLVQAKSRLEALQEIEASGEGYYQGVQAVLKAKKESQLDGIRGSILQLLDIPEKYLTAIENALGSASQNIVVADDKKAQAAIAWLKKEKRGRVTFMPLNLAKGQRQEVNFKDDAVLGLALDLVQFDAQYNAVMSQLLGRVWIVDNLESATQLAKRTGTKYRFVTLEGDVIAPGGTMTGGHQKKQSSIVYRKHEMGVLRERIEEYTKSSKEALIAIQKEKTSLYEIEGKLSEGAEIIQKNQLISKENEVVLTQLSDQQKRLSREIEVEEYSFEELSNQRQYAQNEWEAYFEKIKAFEARSAEITKEIETTRQRLIDLESKQQQDQAQLQEVLVQKALLGEQFQSQSQRKKEAKQEIDALQKSLEDARGRLKTIEGEKVEVTAKLLKIEGTLQETLTRLHTQENQLAEDKDVLRALEGKIQETEGAIGHARLDFDTAWRAYGALEAKVERAEEKLAENMQQLQEAFDMSAEEALEKADFTVDIVNAKERLKAFKIKILQLGDINFTAIEEYTYVTTQAKFLREQLEDLSVAKGKLEAIIREMETTMAERFKAAYEKVNEKFSEVFRLMFGGGSARLELSMPGKYLETGIEIIAQPPGKKERVLTLLSGGERALTAAALLFALLEVRPSPFVILDEIEAALDEANIERFASFVSQYAQNTQFIIISHRRGTMEAASVLYGVTMDNNGVSKQVSVRLSDFNEK